MLIFSFGRRYYDQLEALEGKFPISESQVSWTQSIRVFFTVTLYVAGIQYINEILGILSTDVFEPWTATGSRMFSF